MTVQREKPDHPKNIPTLVKAIILAQSAIILIFTVGMYQEYLSNTYLQQYVVSVLSSNITAGAILSMVTMSVFALGTFMLLGSMSTSRRASKEWKQMTEVATEALDMPSMPVLESVEPRPKRTQTRSRTRQRRSSVGTDQIFKSMRTYADTREEDSEP